MGEVTGITKPHRLKSSAVSQTQKRPSKLYCNFLCKAIIVTIFLVVIPLLPSQAPEFFNQSIFTRSWELLHLIFVGIAVSYGLFSRRNDDDVSNSAVEETCTSNSKFDSTQSFVSTLLEVSSVFDHDSPSSTGSPDDSSSSSKIRTWSSQYRRNEPVVVVSKEQAVVRNEERMKNPTSSVGERPLLLPVRSLKARVSDQTCNESANEDVNSGDPRSFGPSNLSLSSKGTWKNRSEMIRSRSLRSRVGGGTGSDFINRGGDGGVSRSLNRSGWSLISSQEPLNGAEKLRNGSLRSDVAGGTGNNNDLMYVNGNGGVCRSFSRPNANSTGEADLSNEKSNKTINDGFFWGLDDDGGGGDDSSKGAEDEETVVLPSPVPWRSRSGRMEMNEETESLTKRIDRSSNTIDNSISNSTNTSPDKQYTCSGRSSPRKASPSRVSSLESEDICRRRTKYKVSAPGPVQQPPPPPPPLPIRSSFLVKSKSAMTNAEDPPEKELRRSVWSEPKEPTQLRESEVNELLRGANNVGVEPIRSRGSDGSLMGKSVRTITSGETIADARRRGMEAERSEKRSRDCDLRAAIGGPPEENAAAAARHTYPLELTEYPQETRDFLEHVFAGTDDDDESETEEDNQVSKGLGNDHSTVDEGAASGVSDETPPDVDKKADEFIAKFREQIRLQRIDSIRRSSGHASKNSRS